VPAAPTSDLEVVATAVANAVAEHYPGTSFVGSVQTSGSTEPVVLYFATREAEGSDIANATAGLGRLLAQSTPETVTPSFEMVVSGADGASAVRVAFDRSVLQNMDWAWVQDNEGYATEYTVFFQSATSYEWFDELAWRDIVDETKDKYHELPWPMELPAAKLDEAAIRSVATAVAASWSVVGMRSIQDTVTIQTPSSSRSVKIAFESDVSSDGPGSLVRTAGMGSYVMRRLQRDPTVGSVEIRFVDEGTETLRVRYDRRAMDAVDWDKSARPQPWYESVHFLQRSTSYRWINKAAWKELVSIPPPSAKDLPRSK
jgi:hypothetical protein